MTDHSQRWRDPGPPAWEGPVAAVLGVMMLAGLAALVGQATAAALFGHGWAWPPGGATGMTRAVAGLLAGRPGVGLTARNRLPGSAVVYACVGAAEAIAVTVVVTGLAVWLRNRRPIGTRRGMATRAEARAALGTRQLRRAGAILRPDLARGGVS